MINIVLAASEREREGVGAKRSIREFYKNNGPTLHCQLLIFQQLKIWKRYDDARLWEVETKNRKTPACGK